MTTATFSEAARALGFRSRSTLFRLKDSGDLSEYLRPPASPGGAQLLELTPPGRPPLAEHVNRLIRPQANNCERYRRPRIDQRWGVVAGLLSEALTDHGALSLCDSEAQAIAAALPAAMGEAFGAQGLELLRVGLADAGYGWRVGDGTPDNPEAEPEWWREWGRWEPDSEPLENGPFWESVGGIAGGMMGPPFHGMSGGTAVELFRQMQDAIDEVGRGARWDPARWDAASARTLLLEDDEVAAGECSSSRPELERLAAGGLLPPDLQAAAAAALQRYRENDQQAAQALPVVLTD
jgi:hypothetical protein